MRVFILRLAYFIVPLLIVACVGDFILSSALKHSKTLASGEYSSWNELYAGKIESEIAIYGSSRAVVHFDPQIIEDSLKMSCYNLGIDGHNFWMQYFRHNELLSYNKKPKVILYSLDVTSLTEKGDIFNSDQFLPYMLYDKPMKTYTTSYNFFSEWDYYMPLVRYYGNERTIMHALKLLFIKQHDSLGRKKGYHAQSLEWNTDLVEARKMLTYYNVDIDKHACDLFEKFLAECQEQDIKMVFVYSPQYVEGQRFVQNKEAIMDIYRLYSRNYSIPLLDYSTDSICLSKKYFYNSSHLNKGGSELFTRKLGHDLKRLLN